MNRRIRAFIVTVNKGTSLFSMLHVCWKTYQVYNVYHCGRTNMQFFFPQQRDADQERRGCLQRHISRISRNLRYKVNAERRSKTPDWFLDKFEAQSFNDPDEPLYQAKPSKLLCGLKLAFDPTSPSHYRVRNLHKHFITHIYERVCQRVLPHTLEIVYGREFVLKIVCMKENVYGREWKYEFNCVSTLRSFWFDIIMLLEIENRILSSI